MLLIVAAQVILKLREAYKALATHYKEAFAFMCLQFERVSADILMGMLSQWSIQCRAFFSGMENFSSRSL